MRTLIIAGILIAVLAVSGCIDSEYRANVEKLCEKYGGEAVQMTFGDYYCDFIVDDTFGRCALTFINGTSPSFDGKCEYAR